MERRPVGRPRGSGPKQRAREAVANGGVVKASKRPVGRPRTVVPPVSIELGSMIIAGNTSATRPANIQREFSVSDLSNMHISNDSDNPTTGHTRSPHTVVLPSSTSHDPPNLLSQHSTSNIQIIPEENPSRAVDWGDEDEDEVDLECLGEGIGQEFEFAQNEDERGDEVDPLDQNSELQESSCVDCAPPAWLQKAFNSKISESSSENRDENGLPLLYAKHRTIWFPQPSPYFLLLQNEPSPSKLFNPRMCLWDPRALFRIGCPKCKFPLRRHGHISRPRRVVDIDSEFYIIGFRYRCGVCIHPVSGKHTVTFNSWDSRILSMLPQDLAAEFPAILSHRSAISKPLFEIVRSGFQNGMAAKQISDTIRIHHLLKYDTWNILE
uniref:DUF6729 domain-containing protein n=1 Tax=Psilocybe cubensis TaxID=181762 RepID=A0A8H7XMQ7_PSICU